MKLQTRHTFPFPPEKFWASFFHPDWEKEEEAHSDMRTEIVSETKEGDVIVRRTRFHTSFTLPGPVAAAMGASTLSYDQISRIDPQAGTLTWEIVPPAMADKVTARGTMVVRATPTGCERVVDGEITVRVPLFGGKIEKGVAEGIQKGHDAEARRRITWVQAHLA
ncbi:MAG: DUF2505 domain-containing protein [Alphaproteobacteria bacterium]|nr:DUF2505 domain-containing protein [Alphaproteobacteria bacterium]